MKQREKNYYKQPLLEQKTMGSDQKSLGERKANRY